MSPYIRDKVQLVSHILYPTFCFILLKINATFTNGRFLLTTIRATVVTPHVIESENGEEYLRKVFPVGHKIKRTLYWDLPIEFVGSKVGSFMVT